MFGYILKIAISYLIFIYILLPKFEGNSPTHTGFKWFSWAGFLCSFVSIPETGSEFIARSVLVALVFGSGAFIVGYSYSAIMSNKAHGNLNQPKPEFDLNQSREYKSSTNVNNAMTANHHINENTRSKNSEFFMKGVDEDKIYESIAEELEAGTIDKGLWTRFYAESDGDETKTKALYIKKRAERLLFAEKSRLEQELSEAVSSTKSECPSLTQNQIQQNRQLTPQEIAERDAIREKLNNIQSEIISNTQPKYEPEKVALIKKYIDAIKSRSATYETYDRFLYEIGGNIETKGFIIGVHYIITYKGFQTRINNFLEFNQWFVTNVVPDFAFLDI